MSMSRILSAVGVLALLLTGCAGRRFEPTDLEPTARVGDWTNFEFGRFPAGYVDEVAAEVGRAGEWVAEFQRLVDREWPLPVTVVHLPARSLEEIPDSPGHAFFASAEFADLDAYIVYTLDYHLEPTAEGYVPVLAVEARIAPADGTLQPWIDTEPERGTPVGDLNLNYGALSDQFPVLAEGCVVRLMERVGR